MSTLRYLWNQIFRPAKAVPSRLWSIDAIEVEIEGLALMEVLRRDHRNFLGARDCRKRIKELETYKQFLINNNSTTLLVIKGNPRNVYSCRP